MKFENIYIESNDDVSAVVEKILNSRNENLILFLPEQSKITESILNLRLLYREAKSASKNIFLDTNEEEVKIMAGEVGIPILEQEKVSPTPVKKGPAFVRDIAPPKVKKINKERPGAEESEQPIFIKKKKISFTKDVKLKSFSNEEISEKELEKPKKTKKFFKFSKGLLIFILTAIVLFLAVGAMIYFFSRAEIQIITEKTNWQTQSAILASKSIEEADAENFKIPAEYLKFSRQVVQDFPATGTKDIQNKSRGKIKIYNSYSSTAQLLVSNTRFLSQEGKLFRLLSNTTVPGAQVEAGKVIPSFIEAEVIADQAGEEYNIGPSRFTIPGFKGTPKYDKFYAESQDSMKEGYIGQAKVISSEDLSGAKNKLIELAQISLEEEFQSKFPQGFKILNEAKSFNIEKTDFSHQIGERADSFRGNITLSLKIITFRESDVRDVFVYNAQKEMPFINNKELFSFEFQYGIPRVDFERGLLSFPVNASLVFRQKINTQDFKNRLPKMRKDKLQDFFKQFEGIEKINLEIKPSFLPFLPPNSKNLKIVVDPPENHQ